MKYIWITWLFACYPLGSAEIPDYHRIGEPVFNMPCKFDVEDVNCSPVVLSREMVRK